MQKEKIIPRKLLALFLLAFMLVELLLGVLPLTVRAAEKAVYIDETTIEEDFAAFGFDTSFYRKDQTGKRQMIYFIESCYSRLPSERDRFYGLYLWVYNPTCEEINEDGQNKVNLSIGGSEYNNLLLQHLSHTTDHLFYKFRVAEDKAASLLEEARAYSRIHSGERSYCIAGVQLQVGEATSSDYGVEKTFIFTGYACGLDESSEEASTLTMRTEGLEAIHLYLDHTTYRSDGVHDHWYRDAIHTAYFGLPKKYLEEYTKLQRIKAEWDEYKTKEIFVTSSTTAENELESYVGKKLMNGINERLTFRVLWEKTEPFSLGSRDFVAFSKGYNDLEEGDTVDLENSFWSYLGFDYFLMYQNYTPLSRMDWLIRIPESDLKSGKPLSSWELEQYMIQYTAKTGGVKVGGFTSWLFADEIDADRAQKFDPDGDHHILQEIDADIAIDDFRIDGNFWDHLFGDGMEIAEGLYPIVVIRDDTAIQEIKSWNSLNKEHVKAFEAKYFVENNAGSGGNVLADLQKIIDDGLYPVLFRFAVTDYYFSDAFFDNTDAWYDDDYKGSKYLTDVNGYVAQETMFLNFDIISLSFRTKDGGNDLAVIPVVADPINVIPSLMIPPESENIEETEWWQKIMMLLGLILILVVFGTYLMPVFMFLWSNLMNVLYNLAKLLWKVLLWLVGLPFRLLGRIFRR